MSVSFHFESKSVRLNRTVFYFAFSQEKSRNFDDSGFFSIEVIIAALKVFGLDVINFNSSNEIAKRARADPTTQKAYICNFKEHWFTIRKIGQQYFNLNSLLSHPELLSTSYIDLFLTQLQREGYSIFIVTGGLPHCTADDILSHTLATQPNKPQLINAEKKTLPQSSGSQAAAADEMITLDDDCLNMAIEQSLLTNEQDDDIHMQTAISMSLDNRPPDASQLPSTSRSEPAAVSSLDDLTEEQLLEKAIQMSMGQ